MDTPSSSSNLLATLLGTSVEGRDDVPKEVWDFPRAISSHNY